MDMELYQRWADLMYVQPDLTTYQASELLHVAQPKLEACIAAGDRLDTSTPPWLIARCLQHRADELEVEHGLDDPQAAAMRARADELAEVTA